MDAQALAASVEQSRSAQPALLTPGPPCSAAPQPRGQLPPALMRSHEFPPLHAPMPAAWRKQGQQQLCGPQAAHPPPDQRDDGLDVGFADDARGEVTEAVIVILDVSATMAKPAFPVYTAAVAHAGEEDEAPVVLGKDVFFMGFSEVLDAVISEQGRRGAGSEWAAAQLKAEVLRICAAAGLTGASAPKLVNLHRYQETDRRLLPSCHLCFSSPAAAAKGAAALNGLKLGRKTCTANHAPERRSLSALQRRSARDKLLIATLNPNLNLKLCFAAASVG